MQENKKTDYEEQLNHAVQYAVNSGDFSQLKNVIHSSMQGVLDMTMGEVRRSVHVVASEVGKGVATQSGRASGQPVSEQNRAQSNYGNSAYNHRNTVGWQAPSYGAPNVPAQYAPHRTPVRPSGAGAALLTVGIVGTVFASIGLLVSFIVAVAAQGVAANVALAVSGSLLAMFIVMIVAGSKKMGRVQRYKKYWRLLAQRGFCDIGRLAAAVERTKPFVVGELNKMLALGWFPEGHIDDKSTCLIYGKELYQQYLATQEQQQKLIQEQEKREKDTTGLYAVVDAGKQWIQQIRQANDQLPGEVISNKLYQLEEVTTHIFAYVEQRPQKLPEIRRFMEYYLPTTLKLVNAYCEFEAKQVQKGAAAPSNTTVQMNTVEETKREIEESLDTINQAFAALLDNLYQDDAIDISTDISALKAMLAQEGLAQNDFRP